MVIEATLSAVGGGALVATLAKFVFNKILSDITKAIAGIDELSAKFALLREQIAVHAVHIAKISEHEKTLAEHERQLARFESGGYRKW